MFIVSEEQRGCFKMRACFVWLSRLFTHLVPLCLSNFTETGLYESHTPSSAQTDLWLACQAAPLHSQLACFHQTPETSNPELFCVISQSLHSGAYP